MSRYFTKAALFMAMLAGCETPAEEAAIEPDTEIASPAVEEDVITEEIISDFSWVVLVEGADFSQDANLKMTCSLEKEGQLYLSGTHFDSGNVTIGIRVSVPEFLPAEVPVTGLFEGQDASPGEALASLAGSLFGLNDRVFFTAEGTLMLDELEVCAGSFDLSFKSDDGTAIEVKDAVFDIPLENNRL